MRLNNCWSPLPTLALEKILEGGGASLEGWGGEAENYVISHVTATTHCTVCTLQYVQVCYNIYRLSSRAKSL